MAAVKELLRAENDGTLSFGDYTLSSKTKKDNYEFEGDLYKVKTFSEITKLEKNGMFVYESVPGTAVHDFVENEDGVDFEVEAGKDCQITLELLENQEYTDTVNGEVLGQMMTNMGGKLSLSLEMEPGVGQKVSVKK